MRKFLLFSQWVAVVIGPGRVTQCYLEEGGGDVIILGLRKNCEIVPLMGLGYHVPR